MIPKTIHYCWFSGDPFPVEIKLCMDTWQKIIPDFTFRIWNMEDALSLKCNFVNEALECKKWAFAADVVRLYALYTEGGVYMDSDIYLKKRFDEFMVGQFATFYECGVDEYLKKAEEHLPGTRVPFGLQAAFMMGEKRNAFCKAVLDYYYARHFLHEDGSMDMKIAPHIYAEIAESFGLRYINKKQELSDGTVIFDAKFFGKTKRDFCEETFGVHRITQSWKNFNEYPFFKRMEKRLRHYLKVCKYTLFRR